MSEKTKGVLGLLERHQGVDHQPGESSKEMNTLTIGERIRRLRKALDLTQQEFADRIGMKRNSIAQVETGRNTSEQTIFSICREFNVSETWLRTGEGEMFVPSPEESIDELVRAHGLDSLDRQIILEFIKLKSEDREAVKKYVRNLSQHISPAVPAFAPAPARTVEEEARAEAEQHTQRIYEQILAEKKAQAGLSSESSGPSVGSGTAKRA